MGWFVYLNAKLVCIRCRHTSDCAFQTKLFRSSHENQGRSYGVGDGVEIDGLDDYCPLQPRSNPATMTIIVGDWSCDHCGLNWQWAKMAVDLPITSGNPVAVIREISAFHPVNLRSFDDVHFLESDLAELSGIWQPDPDYSWPAGYARWLELPILERCQRLVAGYIAWCHDVAGIGVGDF
jgi:hypothetical protein